jgi:hypothetical protein
MEMIKSIAITVVAVIIALYVKDMIDGSGTAA